MKNLLMLLCLYLSVHAMFAQKIIERRVDLQKNKEVVVDFQFADNITITGWDHNEVYIKVSVNINENRSNDKFILHVDEASDKLRIESEIEDMKKLHTQKTIKDEDGDVVTYNCTVEMELLFEVFVPRGSTLKVETISGDIELFELTGEMDIKTISGFVDFSADPKAKYTFELSTITGGIFSDLDLEYDKEDSKGLVHLGGNHLDATLNGGGKDIILETISGDIYLRKK